MANGIAGVAQSADRRRRRLSHELAEEESHLTPVAEPDFQDVPSSASGMLWKSEFDTQLLRKVVSSSLWKHVTAILVLMVVCGSCVYLLMTSISAQLQHSIGRLASLMLLVGGQLAMLIGWIRSESQLDFQGRYRWWKLLALALLGAAVLRLTDSSGWVSDQIISLIEMMTGPLDSARRAVLLVPALIAGVLLVYRIVPDMQRCFGSQLIMVLAVVATVAQTGWGVMEFQDVSHRVTASLDLIVPVLLFSSLLLHAHYVVYINHDPPVLIQKSVTEAVLVANDSNGSEAIAQSAASEPTGNDVSAELQVIDANRDSEDATGKQKADSASSAEKPRPKRRRKKRKAA